MQVFARFSAGVIAATCCSPCLALKGKSTEVLKAFTESLAQWRFETSCVVFEQLVVQASSLTDEPYHIEAIARDQHFRRCGASRGYLFMVCGKLSRHKSHKDSGCLFQTRRPWTFRTKESLQWTKRHQSGCSAVLQHGLCCRHDILRLWCKASTCVGRTSGARLNVRSKEALLTSNLSQSSRYELET